MKNYWLKFSSEKVHQCDRETDQDQENNGCSAYDKINSVVTRDDKCIYNSRDRSAIPREGENFEKLMKSRKNWFAAYASCSP